MHLASNGEESESSESRENEPVTKRDVATDDPGEVALDDENVSDAKRGIRGDSATNFEEEATPDAKRGIATSTDPFPDVEDENTAKREADDVDRTDANSTRAQNGEQKKDSVDLDVSPHKNGGDTTDTKNVPKTLSYADLADKFIGDPNSGVEMQTIGDEWVKEVSGDFQEGETSPGKITTEGEVSEELSDDEPPEFDQNDFMWWRAARGGVVTKISRAMRNYIVCQPWFDTFILCVIIANCITMMLEKPNQDNNFGVLELTFNIIFIVEMVLKWIGLGFFGPATSKGVYKSKWGNGLVLEGERDYSGYFSDNWNVLDFVIVMASIAGMMLEDVSGMSAIRLLRVFRPLRSINKIPNLKILIETIQESVEGLRDVLIILMFIFFCYGIMGVQIFSGAFHRRCFTENIPVSAGFDDYNADESNDQFCRNVADEDCQGLCKSSDCPIDYPRCLEIAPNPYEGLVSWDNIFYAVLQVFWVSSGEQWVNVMYYAQDSYSAQAWIFYYSVVVIVTWFGMNLCLAVVEGAYEAEREEAEEEAAEETPFTMWLATMMSKTDHDSEEVNDHHDMMDKLMTDTEKETYDPEIMEKIFQSFNKKGKNGDSPEVTRVDSITSIGSMSKGNSMKGVAKAPMQLMERMSQVEGNKQLIENENAGIKTDRRGRTDRLMMDNDPLQQEELLATEREEDFKIAYKAWFEAKIFDDDDWLLNAGPIITYTNKLVRNEWFNHFITMIIVGNTVTLCIYWPSISDDTTSVLESINIVFMLIFIVEMILKHIGVGLRGYWRDPWNRFDGIIVIMSVVDYILSQFDVSTGGSLSVLRTFRLLRVIRVAGRIEALRTLINAVMESMGDTFYLTLLLMIFLFIFAILGQNLFGDKWHEIEDPDNTATFGKNFWYSFLLVFQTITGDNWNGLMTDTVKISSHWSIFYHILVLCIGAFLLLNVFIAILLSRMGDQDDEKWLEEDAYDLAIQLTLEDWDDVPAIRRIMRHLRVRRFEKTFKRKLLQWKLGKDRSVMMGKSFGIFKRNNKLRIWCNYVIQQWWFSSTIDVAIVASCIFLALENVNRRGESIFKTTEVLFTVLFLLEMVIKMIALGVWKAPWFSDIDWYEVFPEDDELEKIEDKCAEIVAKMRDQDDSRVYLEYNDDIVHKVVESEDLYRVVQFQKTEDMRIVFDQGQFKGAFIMTREDNGNYQWKEWKFMDPQRRQDVVTVGKSISLTNENHNAYMASNWDRLDFLVVVVGVISLIDSSLTAFRALRAIRPLRIAIRVQQVKVVLSAIIRAFPGMMSAVMFCTLFWIILAVLGMKWFSGALYSCSCEFEDVCENIGDPDCCPADVAAYLETVTTKAQCLNQALGQGYLSWDNLQWNFDNVFASMHTLFTVSTLSGWAETMYACIASRGVDKQPEQFNNPVVGAYFIIAQIVCSFFTMNLIIGAVIDNFNRIRDEKNGSAFLTQRQLLWQRKKRLSSKIKLVVKPVPPEGQFRQRIFDIVENPMFEGFIVICIIMNTCFMAAEHFGMSNTLKIILWFMDLVFIIIFTLEAVLKITGYGRYVYFASTWNKFDFFIVIAGIVSLLPFLGVGVNVFRLFRIGRLLRLVNKAATLRLLFWTLVYAAPSLWNVGILIFVIFYIYAIIGMALFGEDSCGYKNVDPSHCEEDFSKIGFAAFPEAMNLLFRVSTEDGWTDVYATFQEWAGDREWQVIVYFCSFFLLGTMVIVNLFIAIVLDVYEQNREESEEMLELDIVYEWRKHWKKFDPQATGTLPAKDFVEVIKAAPAPTGLGKLHATDEEVAAFMYELYLLATLEESDADKNILNGVAGFLNSCRRTCFRNSTVGTNLRQNREPGNDGVWTVEYSAAVTAISLHVLNVNGSLEIPIVITPEDDEKFIADWFCSVHLKNVDLLQKIRDRREAKEMKVLEQQKQLWQKDFESDGGTFPGLKTASKRTSTTQLFWELKDGKLSDSEDDEDMTAEAVE